MPQSRSRKWKHDRAPIAVHALPITLASGKAALKSLSPCGVALDKADNRKRSSGLHCVVCGYANVSMPTMPSV
jgi:hypothetical protein